MANGTPSFSVARTGVDTVSFAWRPPPSSRVWSTLLISAEQGHISGVWRLVPGLRGSFRLKDRLAGAFWFIDPDHELIYAEGRLAPILSGDGEDRSLGRLGDLSQAAEVLGCELATVTGEEDAETLGEPRLRRLDLAADIRFRDPSDGIATLRALSHLSLPRVKVNEWRHQGRTETVSFFSSAKKKNLLHRVYDKGVESKTDRPGICLRFERQMRWQGKQQPTIAEIAGHPKPGELWLQNFEDWAGAAEQVHVGTIDDAQNRILWEMEGGLLDRQAGERLLGALTIARLRGEGWWHDQGKPHLGHRRRKDLARLGLSLSASPDGAAEVELGNIIRALRDAWNPQESRS